MPGNHDKDWNNKLVQGTFIVEQPITVLKIDGSKYVLSHFPMADWQSMHMSQFIYMVIFIVRGVFIMR